jgi:hypothetical protein
MRHPCSAAVAISSVALLWLTDAAAQDPVQAARAYGEAHRAEIVAELRDFVAIPKVAIDPVNIRRNATALVAMMERRGIATRVLEAGGPPVVYGEIGDTNLPTILFCCQHDGQPADPAEWAQDSPWTPVLRSESIENGGELIAGWARRRGTREKGRGERGEGPDREL